jgi:hypothetical protein
MSQVETEQLIVESPVAPDLKSLNADLAELRKLELQHIIALKVLRQENEELRKTLEGRKAMLVDYFTIGEQLRRAENRIALLETENRALKGSLQVEQSDGNP